MMADGGSLLADVMNRVSIPIHATVRQVLDFLQEKSKSFQLNTVLGYVTAISNRHAPVEGQALSVDKIVKKWVSGLKLTKGVAKSLVHA